MASDAYTGSQDVVPAPLAIEPCAAADAGVKLETPGVRASTRLLGTSRSRGGSRGRGSSGSSSSLSFVTAGDKLPSGAEGLTPTPTTAIIPATAAAAATSGEGATGTTEGAAANAEAVVKAAAATACVETTAMAATSNGSSSIRVAVGLMRGVPAGGLKSELQRVLAARKGLRGREVESVEVENSIDEGQSEDERGSEEVKRTEEPAEEEKEGSREGRDSE